MKKNSSKLMNLLLIAALVTTGCQKVPMETQTIPAKDEIGLQPGAERSNMAQGCLLTVYDYYNGLTDEHQVDQFSYKNGLIDEWKASYGTDYQFEYDGEGKVKTAKGYEAGVLVYNIHFFYTLNRVSKEIWYDANSDMVLDDYHYTFDRKGQIIRSESTVLGYHTENIYTPNGDLESWKFFQDGIPVVSGHYTYSHQYKSPLREGTPGIEYNFAYSNSAFGQTKWWYSSEKVILYDEFGAASVFYDLDPLQTEWHGAPNGNLESVDYTDRQTESQFTAVFEYENCREGNGTTNTRKALPVYRRGLKLNPLTLLERNPSKSKKAQVKELRQQLLK